MHDDRAISSSVVAASPTIVAASTSASPSIIDPSVMNFRCSNYDFEKPI